MQLRKQSNPKNPLDKSAILAKMTQRNIQKRNEENEKVKREINEIQQEARKLTYQRARHPSSSKIHYVVFDN